MSDTESDSTLVDYGKSSSSELVPTRVPLQYKPPSPVLSYCGSLLGLREPTDVITIMAVVLCCVVNVLIWNVASQIPVWQTLALWLCLVQLTMTVSTIVHNTIHANIFIDKSRNRSFHIVLTACFGHPVSTFVSAHNLSHHRYTQMNQDYMRTTQMRYKYHLWNYLCFFGRVSSTISASDMRYMRLQRKQKRKIWTDFALQMSTVVAMHVLCACISPVYWILFWNLPRISASVFITNMNMLQHDGCQKPVVVKMGDPLNRTPESGELAPIHLININTSRNFTGSITNFLFFNNGFHNIHHIKPTLHWSKLPQAHQHLVQPHIHPNLDQPNMAVYFWNTFVMNNRTRFDGTPYDPNIDECQVEPENEDWFQYPQEFEHIKSEAPQRVMLDIAEDFVEFVYAYAIGMRS